MATVDDLLKEYATLSRLPADKVDIGRLNKVKELLGEAGAEAEVARKYGPGKIRHVSVPRRGTSGAQILDILYELENGELVLVESKYGESLLGRTLDRHVYVVGVSEGKAVRTQLPLKRQVKQLDHLWIKDRIAEIERQDPALAKRLQNAVDKEQLKVLEVRTEVDQSGSRLTSEITDHSERIREQAKSGRRFVDDERRHARREAIADVQLESLEAQAKQEAKLAEQAKKKAKQAENAVATAKKDLDAAKRPETKTKRQAILAEKQRAAEELRVAASEAEATAKKSDDARKLAKKLKQNDTAARKSAEATKRLEAAQKLEATRAARGKPGTSPVSKEAGAIADAAVADTRAAVTSAEKAAGTRMVENRLGAPVAAEALARTGAKELVDVAANVAAKTSRARAVLEFAGKGLRLTAKVGRVAFVILDLANPIFDVLMAVELVDALVGWLRRDKIREEQEWLRLNDFLVGAYTRTVSPYGVVYWTSVRPMVNAFIELKLADESYDRNFLHWFKQWNQMPRKFRGFVYGQIDIDMERQEESTDGPYKVKYYADAPHLSFFDVPQPNRRVVTSRLGWKGPQDKDNRSTNGGEVRYDPEYSISVDISFQSVTYTPPQPTLTPFDFVIVKCRHLITEIVSFMSRFDPSIIEGMDIRTEIIDPAGIFRGEKVYWLKGQTFASPLESDEIHFCLKTTYWVIDTLDGHALRDGDYRRKDKADKFNAGYYRRLAILRLATSSKGALGGSERYAVRPMHDVAGHLRQIVSKYDKGIVADIEYLMDLATSIDDDLRLVLKECQSSAWALEYNYNGRPA
jgi:hypothetical protein